MEKLEKITKICKISEIKMYKTFNFKNKNKMLMNTCTLTNLNIFK